MLTPLAISQRIRRARERVHALVERDARRALDDLRRSAREHREALIVGELRRKWPPF